MGWLPCLMFFSCTVSVSSCGKESLDRQHSLGYQVVSTMSTGCFSSLYLATSS